MACSWYSSPGRKCFRTLVKIDDIRDNTPTICRAILLVDDNNVADDTDDIIITGYDR